MRIVHLIHGDIDDALTRDLSDKTKSWEEDNTDGAIIQAPKKK
jgi:hypothetical protein